MGQDSWDELPATLATADLQKLLNIRPATVSRWLRAGIIPSHRIGTSWITFRCDVTAWLASTANNPTTTRAPDPHPLEAYPRLLSRADLEVLFGKRRSVIGPAVRSF